MTPTMNTEPFTMFNEYVDIEKFLCALHHYIKKIKVFIENKFKIPPDPLFLTCFSHSDYETLFILQFYRIFIPSPVEQFWSGNPSMAWRRPHRCVQ